MVAEVMQRVKRAVAAIEPVVRPVVDGFATPLTLEHYVELVNPLWSQRRMQARVVETIDETRDSRTIVLQPGRNWRRHRAGQHMRIGLSVDGRQYTRTYTISSSPERRDGYISITVKILDGGRMSNVLVRDLDVGSHIPIGIPQGEFVLPEARPVAPLFISAGSGITPIASMLRTFDLVGNMADTVHIHYAPHEYDFILGAEMHDLADRHRDRYRLAPIYTRALGDADRSSQHFSAEQLDELCPDWRLREVWACGPQSLLDALDEHFAAAGRSHAFHTERFRAATIDLGDVSGGTVTFARADGSTVEVEADGATPLLRVAEDAGLNPAHGCRMGICHTCDTPLISGTVRDLRTGDCISEPGHTVQPCVAAAAGACAVSVRQ